MDKTNKRFGVWSSEGMKKYDEIIKFVESDRELNQQVEHQLMNFMMRKNQTYVPKLFWFKYSQIHIVL